MQTGHSVYKMYTFWFSDRLGIMYKMDFDFTIILKKKLSLSSLCFTTILVFMKFYFRYVLSHCFEQVSKDGHIID